MYPWICIADEALEETCRKDMVALAFHCTLHGIGYRAREVGLSRPSYLRACALGTPGPRARRTPPVNAEALGRATAALNRVGSNINQIAHVLNMGGSSISLQECFAALAEVRAAAATIREIVGRKDRT